MRFSDMMMCASALIAQVFANTAGCGKAPSSIKAGTNTVTVNGKQRQWILTLPDNYDNTKPYRLIFGLHWLGGNMTDVSNGGIISPYYGMPPLLNNTAIFVSPNGLISGAYSGWGNANGEDITFISAILNATDANLCIDETLRFAMGFSYGAAMSYSIACSLPSSFRAVAALSGGPISGCAGGTTPVAYYAQHGISDQALPISMGREMRDRFVKNNGCKAMDAKEPAKGSQTHVVNKYEGCKEGKPVWWTAFDADHTPIPADNGTSSRERTWTAGNVWAFFGQFG